MYKERGCEVDDTTEVIEAIGGENARNFILYSLIRGIVAIF